LARLKRRSIPWQSHPTSSHERTSTEWPATRVSLDSIVYAFLDGHTAESIQQSFPLLTLEQVYGAITYYLAHWETIEAYLREQEAAFETLKALSTYSRWCHDEADR